MLTRLSVWAAVATTLAAIIRPSSGAVQIAATTAICAAALVAGLQADRLGRYLWLSAFVAIFVVFNPVMGVELQGRLAFVLTMLSLAAFVSWLAVLHRTAPIPAAAHVPHADSVK